MNYHVANLLNHDLPILKLSDTVAAALTWFEEYRVGELVVVDDKAYIGTVSEDTLLNYEEEMPLSEVLMQYLEIYLTENQHIFEALAIITKYKLEVMAVLDHERNFVGVLKSSDVFHKFSELLGTQEAGAIIVIALNNREYSLAEISRLIETERGKILSCFVSGSQFSEDDSPRLTLKLNIEYITPIINTLQRFGYEIEASFAHERLESIEQENYDMLMRYLSV